jgi:hypothetical protein
MSNSALSFVPNDGIIVATEKNLAEIISFPMQQALGGPAAVAQLIRNDPAPAEDFKFTLFSKEFISLQITIAQVLGLPITEGEFEKKYGTFGRKQTVLDCLTALDTLGKHCKKFGNPSTLFTEIEKLGEGARPTELYARLVWLAQRIVNASESFQFTLESLWEMLEKLTDPQRRYQALKSLLGSEGGLISKAEEMAKESIALRNAVGTYREEMKTIKKPVDDYFSVASKIYSEAKKQREDLADLITANQAALDAAKDDYVKYCAAASGSSIGLIVISGGMAWPLAAIAGGVLGAMAEEARKRKNALDEERSRLSAAVAPKIALLTDINGLETAITPLEAQLGKVYDGLGDIYGVWNNVVLRYGEILKEATPEKLKNLDDFSTSNRIIEAQKRWRKIAESTERFTARAFVDFKS